MTSWGKISVGWRRIYAPTPVCPVGMYLVVFLTTQDWLIPAKVAVVNDFGDLVEVPA
jgi:hypothetical protein